MATANPPKNIAQRKLSDTTTGDDVSKASNPTLQPPRTRMMLKNDIEFTNRPAQFFWDSEYFICFINN
jgi:hypothetical protein